MLTALENFRAGKGYFFSALLVTDVVEQSSLLLLTGSLSLRQQVDYPELETGIYELSGVVSRKSMCCPTSRIVWRR